MQPRGCFAARLWQCQGTVCSGTLIVLAGCSKFYHCIKLYWVLWMFTDVSSLTRIWMLTAVTHAGLGPGSMHCQRSVTLWGRHTACIMDMSQKPAVLLCSQVRIPYVLPVAVVPGCFCASQVEGGRQAAATGLAQIGSSQLPQCDSQLQAWAASRAAGPHIQPAAWNKLRCGREDRCGRATLCIGLLAELFRCMGFAVVIDCR